MKSIKLLLLAIFLLTFSICLNVMCIGYIMPNYLRKISLFLPIVAIIVMVCAFLKKD